MHRSHELETLWQDLQGIDAASARDRFTDLFRRGCELLNLDDEDAARAFDTSRPNVSRWKRGTVVPPAAMLVLRFLREEVDAKVNGSTGSSR